MEHDSLHSNGPVVTRLRATIRKGPRRDVYDEQDESVSDRFEIDAGNPVVVDWKPSWILEEEFDFLRIQVQVRDRTTGSVGVVNEKEIMLKPTSPNIAWRITHSLPGILWHKYGVFGICLPGYPVYSGCQGRYNHGKA